MFLNYLKLSAWHFLLSSVSAFFLCLMAFRGFYIRADQQDNYILLVLIILVLNAVLTVAFFRKKNALVIAVCAAVLVTAALAYFHSRGILEGMFQDSYGNPYKYYLIAIVLTVGVFFLSLKKKGTVALALVGIFISAGIEYLYSSNQLLFLAIFLVCCIMNYMLLNFRMHISDAQDQGASFRKAFIASLCVCLVVLAAGGAAYYGIVKTINPPRKIVKLITKEESYTLVDRTGTVKTEEKENKQLQSKNTKSVKNPNSGSNSNSTGSGANPLNKIVSLANAKGVSIQRDNQAFERLMAFLIVLAAVVAGTIIWKMISRKLWLSRISRYPREEQISLLYHFYLKKFHLMKLSKKAEETPYEYVLREHEGLGAFCTELAGMDMLTDIFVKSNYGHIPVTENEYSAFVDFYKKFFGLCRKYLGPWKTAIKFIRL